MAAKRNRKKIWGYFTSKEEVDEEVDEEEDNDSDDCDDSIGLLDFLDVDDMVAASSGGNMVPDGIWVESTTSAYRITLLSTLLSIQASLKQSLLPVQQ